MGSLASEYCHPVMTGLLKHNKEVNYRLQYSIYAGRHVVPGVIIRIYSWCKSGVEPSQRA